MVEGGFGRAAAVGEKQRSFVRSFHRRWKLRSCTRRPLIRSPRRPPATVSARFRRLPLRCRLLGFRRVPISGGWRHTMALTTDGRLYGWGWNKFGQLGLGDNDDHCSPVLVRLPEEQTVKQISCGWRHTLALTERGNVFSWGRGTSGQLGHGDILDRNTPKMIEAISKDGLGCKQIESSNVLPSSGKIWVSPSERYAIVPDETADKVYINPIKGNGSDANVPENDVKRMRV